MGGSIGIVDHRGSLPLLAREKTVQVADRKLRPVTQQFAGGAEGGSSRTASGPVITAAVLPGTVPEAFDKQVVLSYDKRINQVIMKVIRASTEEVIRQIPPPEIVELLAKFRENLRGLLVDHTS